MSFITYTYSFPVMEQLSSERCFCLSKLPPLKVSQTPVEWFQLGWRYPADHRSTPEALSLPPGSTKRELKFLFHLTCERILAQVTVVEITFRLSWPLRRAHIAAYCWCYQHTPAEAFLDLVFFAACGADRRKEKSSAEVFSTEFVKQLATRK